MWRLNKIYAENICAFKEYEYTLNNRVTTLVFGDNRDNESQQSNGSGKSAVIETIAIGIAGSPLRKVKQEEIIRDDADSCSIRLEFKNDSATDDFVIERSLFRKGGSEVKCFIGDNQVVQPSIDMYNKYILETLGISKDELYNNFILSKFKYQEFLSCSDKEKKEIINRFSNGNLVDQAIESLANDMLPVEEEFRANELEFAGNEGRIEVLQEQIETEENSKDEKAKSKADKVLELEHLIEDKQLLISEKKKEITVIKRAEANVYDADSIIQEIENSDSTIDDCVTVINENLAIIPDKLSNWDDIISSRKNSINQLNKKLGEKETETAQLQRDYAATISNAKQIELSYTDFIADYNECYERYRKDYDFVITEIKVKNDYLSAYKKNVRLLRTEIESLKNKLAGTITCPECKHEFLLSDNDFSISEAQKELESKEDACRILSNDTISIEKEIDILDEKQAELLNRKKALTLARNGWDDKLSFAKRSVQQITNDLENGKLAKQQVINQIVTHQEELANMRRKIFDEAYDIIDTAYKTNERKREMLLEEIKTIEGSITALQDSITELQSKGVDEHLSKLKDTLKGYKEKSISILHEKSGIEKRLHGLKEQEQHFIHFKTYLANTKIEALSKITNEFLENIGSDIKIKFSGYTYLKSGKVREKISVSLIRSGIDCGSFGKFSAGESARVNLATILAMQKLINANCEGDKGLDLLVLDEILEAVDESGLAHMFEALNSLGITALVVSHGNIAESYPYKLKVVKENGESRVEL